MAVPEEQLAQMLMDAGTRLLSPPSSVEDLLPLLDEVELCLERVDQSPSRTMQDALSPALKALVSDEVLGHSDSDVKVYVATCISEITRITAPDAPYDDDQMKEIFQLTVSCFENLHDMASRSYGKRAAILEIVAKVRSCVVMLDLKCDDLILQMFEHFFKSVRDYHPLKVFASMERIMTLVLEEFEERYPELLFMILGYLRKDDKNVDSPAWMLGEMVLHKCSSKVVPYLVQVIQSLGVSLDDYHNVVSSLCQKSSAAVECNEKRYDDHTENKDAEESKSNKDEGELKIKPQTKFKGSSKKRGRRNILSKFKLAASTANDAVKETLAEEVCKEPYSSPKCVTKAPYWEIASVSSKKGSDQKSSYKKRVANKEKVSSENENPGEELVGSTIKVWRPKDYKFYEGVVVSFTPSSKKHTVFYKDGVVEMLSMKMEKWEFVKVSNKGVSSDGDCPDAASEMHKKKKIKTNLEPSNKEGKTPSANMTDSGKQANRSKVAVPKPKLSEDKMDVEHNTSSGIDKEVGANQEAEEKQAEADEVEEEHNPDKCHAQVQSLKLIEQS